MLDGKDAELAKLQERCEAYKGQVEAGAAEIAKLRAALNYCRMMASRDGPPIAMATNILNEIEETAKDALRDEQSPPTARQVTDGTENSFKKRIG